MKIGLILLVFDLVLFLIYPLLYIYSWLRRSWTGHRRHRI